MGLFEEACKGLKDVEPARLLEQLRGNLYDGIREPELLEAAVLAARALIEVEPNYSFVTARLLLDRLKTEVNETLGHPETMLTTFVKKGIEWGQLDPELACFDLARLEQAIEPERDLQFTYLGLQTLYDRYLLSYQDRRFELPQAFFMRVAMGLAVREVDRDEKAIEFYRLLSSCDFIQAQPFSTPAPSDRNFRLAFLAPFPMI